MLGKLWFKIAAAVVAVLIVIAIATPFLADVIVRQQLEGAGATWSKVSRDGFEWRFRQFAQGPVTAREARLKLSSKPSLALRGATFDLHQLLTTPKGMSAAPPEWLYISADPFAIQYGDNAIATGMRGRLSSGRLVGSGPTMNLKGQWGDRLQLELDGDVPVGAGVFDGVARITLSSELAIEVASAKFVVIKDRKVLASDVSAELAGANVEALTGKVSVDKTEGALTVSCDTRAEGCRLEVSPGDHAFAQMLAQWPDANLDPPPEGAASTAYEFKLGQLSLAR